MSPDQLISLAIDQATAALAHAEVPIGCVIHHAPTNRIIAAAHNRRILDQDPTAHAEIIAIRHAARELGDWRLEDTTLAVTLEPCPMCAGAIVNARIPRLIYGTADPKAGAVQTLYQLCSDPRLNHRVQIDPPLRSAECAALLTDFFAAKRAQGKK